MMRSMFAGVSGIRAHQTRMDVIGNNLANVNTTGFKFSRVTFKDMLNQTIRGGTAPTATGTGGVNPAQVGLGVLVAGIDTIHSQGNLQATGKPTDMAIQGNGFFVLNNGSTIAFSRDGSFDINANGVLINPSNGYRVQGWQAVNGTVDTSGPVGDIVIPIGSRMVAQATSNVYLVGNLNADAEIGTQGSISRSDYYLAGYADATSLLSGLFDDQPTANPLNLTSGDVIHLHWNDGTSNDANYTVSADATLGDLTNWLSSQLGASVTVDVTSTGQVRITNNGTTTINSLSITVSGNTVFNNVFDDISSTIASGGGSDTSASMERAATANDSLSILTTAQGNSLGLTSGDVVYIGAFKGGIALSTLSGVVGVNFNTLGELAEYIEDVFGITSDAPGVSIDSLGRMVIAGDIGSGNEFSNISITATNASGTVQRSYFNAVNNYSTIQHATGESATLSMTVYDSLGVEHRVTMIFTRIAPNTWKWNADCADDSLGGRNISNGMQTISFLTNGSYNTSTGVLSIDLDNGANSPLMINPDMTMFTQFSGDSAISLRQQDGYPMGILEKFSIGASGDITGIYSNGLTDLLGKIALATFSNPGGLLKEGENLYKQSMTSGVAQIGEPGTGGRGTINNGVLEMSNVDLAREFTDMIITQRGFQASSRIITTSDELLQELVNLKR